MPNGSCKGREQRMNSNNPQKSDAPKAVQTGALILAAGMSSRMGDFKPLLPLGPYTIVQRVIHTFRQTGVAPIVLVTGHQAALLEAHVSDMQVVCLRNEQYTTTQMLDSSRIGFAYLKERCEQILLTPVDIPLFTMETVRKLMCVGADVAIPTHGGRKGHPLLISRAIIDFAETYDGPGGLAGVMRESGCQIQLIEVDDPGILMDADTPEDYERLLGLYFLSSGL